MIVQVWKSLMITYLYQAERGKNHHYHVLGLLRREEPVSLQNLFDKNGQRSVSLPTPSRTTPTGSLLFPSLLLLHSFSSSGYFKVFIFGFFLLLFVTPWTSCNICPWPSLPGRDAMNGLSFWFWYKVQFFNVLLEEKWMLIINFVSQLDLQSCFFILFSCIAMLLFFIVVGLM